MYFMKFKEMLIQFRERRGFNKSEIANRLDATPTYYIELESGRRGAPKNEYSLILQWKKDYLAMLLNGSPEKKKSSKSQ